MLCTHKTTILCQFGIFFVTSLLTHISINSQPFLVGIVSHDIASPEVEDVESTEVEDDNVTENQDIVSIENEKSETVRNDQNYTENEGVQNESRYNLRRNHA